LLLQAGFALFFFASPKKNEKGARQGILRLCSVHPFAGGIPDLAFVLL
jgi:hypothetical protein